MSRGILRDHTYMSRVEGDSPFHSILVVENYGKILALYHIQILLFPILHL
jgi:hypothetical protein